MTELFGRYIPIPLEPPRGYLPGSDINNDPDAMGRIIHDAREVCAYAAPNSFSKNNRLLTLAVAGSPYCTPTNPKSEHFMLFPTNLQQGEFIRVQDMSIGEFTEIVRACFTYVDTDPRRRIAGYNQGVQGVTGVRSSQGWRNFHAHLLKVSPSRPIQSAPAPVIEIVKAKIDKQTDANKLFVLELLEMAPSFFQRAELSTNTSHRPNQFQIAFNSHSGIIDAAGAGLHAIDAYLREKHCEFMRSIYPQNDLDPGAPLYTVSFDAKTTKPRITITFLTEPGGNGIGLMEAMGIYPIRPTQQDNALADTPFVPVDVQKQHFNRSRTAGQRFAHIMGWPVAEPPQRYVQTV